MKDEKLSLESAEAVYTYTKKRLLKNREEQKGITLVALVVTIVVLLILAGITIMYTMGENSIFKKAQDAKDKTAEAIKNEQEYMN
ncbi:MAG: type II secretion system protein, partial [Clostridia bacterium]|nr:type II secretion system protein [Clostridia bacterium]